MRGHGQERVTAPHGPGDDLGAAVGELAGDFRKEAVVTHHHAHGAEPGREDGVIGPAAIPASISPRGRQTLRYLPTIWPSGRSAPRCYRPGRRRARANRARCTYCVAAQLAKILGGRTGDRFGHVRVRFAESDKGERLAEYGQGLGFLEKLYQRAMQVELILRGLKAERSHWVNVAIFPFGSVIDKHSNHFKLL